MDGATWAVPGALEGERLDRAIALVAGVTRAEADRLVTSGRVRIGRRVTTSRSRRVHAGETVSVEGSVGTVAAAPPAPEPTVEVPVVYSDEHLIVVDKPAGLVVHPGAGNRSGTLVNGLLALFPDLSSLATGELLDRPGVVHRLDKGTSGLLAVARTPQAHGHLASQLARRTMGREYLTLVEGTVESEAGLVDGPLGRSDTDPTRIRVQVGGRQARTGYQVERRFEGPPPATLLRCRLETGRTHQIRVHLSSIGHPVVGDDRYGGRRDPALAEGRPFLHAAVLELVHPTTGERLRFESALPEDLARALSARTGSRG